MPDDIGTDLRTVQAKSLLSDGATASTAVGSVASMPALVSARRARANPPVNEISAPRRPRCGRRASALTGQPLERGDLGTRPLEVHIEQAPRETGLTVMTVRSA